MEDNKGHGQVPVIGPGAGDPCTKRLNCASCMPGTALFPIHYLITLIAPIEQMRRLKTREVIRCAQDHTGGAEMRLEA